MGKRVGFWGIACAWLVLVSVGFCLLEQHVTDAGAAIHASSTWPGGDQLPRTPGMYTVVMLVHPECPCTRASVNELAVLMSRCFGKVNGYVVFAEMDGLKEDSAAVELWKSAAEIDGIKCVHDPRAELTARFGAKTSGQIFLYDPRGALQFSGGITISRGHSGDSDGLGALVAIINNRQPTTRQTPVFGCTIR